MSSELTECPTCEKSFDTDRGVKIHHMKSHGESIAEEIEKTCPECDEDFTVGTQSRDQIHCSEDCRYESMRESVEIECETCGETVEIPPNEEDDRRFCSRDCRKEMFNDEIVCENCEQTFDVYRWESDRRRFCSRDCRNESQRVKLECEWCNDDFVVPKSSSDNRRFCDEECFRASMPSKAEVEQACKQCSDTFVGEESRQFCSVECHRENQRNKLTLVCEWCEEEYKKSPSKADESKYCSWSCRTKGIRNWVRKQCKQCDHVFQTTEYEDNEFCSGKCWNDFRADQAEALPRKRCDGCDISFKPDRKNKDQEFCTLSCWYEFQRSTETRPDTIDDLLTECYEDRELNVHQTYKRVNTALHHSEYQLDGMTKDEVRDRLKVLGIYRSRSADSYHTLVEADADEVFGDNPDGDDSWRQLYQQSDDRGEA